MIEQDATLKRFKSFTIRKMEGESKRGSEGLLVEFDLT